MGLPVSLILIADRRRPCVGGQRRRRRLQPEHDRLHPARGRDHRCTSVDGLLVELGRARVLVASANNVRRRWACPVLIRLRLRTVPRGAAVSAAPLAV